VIGAYNSCATLIPALRAIEASSLNQRHPGLLEVIIVDDGSTDGTFETVRSLEWDLRLRCLRQEQAGLTAAHNTALSFATGDVLIFSDADVIHTPFALEHMLVRHERLGPALLVGFRFEVDAPDRDTRPSFWQDFRLSFPGTPQGMARPTDDFRAYGHARTLRMSNGALYDLPAMVVGAFFSLPRADLERMGGSDARLTGWGCEDSVIGAGAIGLGRRIVPVYAAASAHVSHPQRDAAQNAQFQRNVAVAQRILREPFPPRGGFDPTPARRRVVAAFETRPRRETPRDVEYVAVDDPAWWSACNEALGRWDRALETAPDALARGRILRRSGDPVAALAELPPTAHHERGLAYAAAGDHARARAELDAAGARWELDTPAEEHKRRGNHHAAQGLHAAAVEDFDLALAGDETAPWTHHDRGASLLSLGRSAEAVAALRRADALLHPQDGNRAWLHVSLGEALHADGRRGAAKAELERALRHDPRNPRARAAVERLEADARETHGIVIAHGLEARVRDIPGWLSPDEIDLLAAVAAHAASRPGTPRVVELGSFCGRSTVVLGHAVRAASGGGGRVYAIDPHAGYAMAPDGFDSHAALVANLDRHGLDPVVEIVRARSREVAWDGPVALLFIDALHDEEEVRADFAVWAPRVEPGGLVAFHDYADYSPGVQACVDDVLGDAEWDFAAHADSLLVVARSG
jgi:predicted O-methyltransferase YrrM/GT2 family glycosyltransferase